MHCAHGVSSVCRKLNKGAIVHEDRRLMGAQEHAR